MMLNLNLKWVVKKKLWISKKQSTARYCLYIYVYSIDIYEEKRRKKNITVNKLKHCGKIYWKKIKSQFDKKKISSACESFITSFYQHQIHSDCILSLSSQTKKKKYDKWSIKKKHEEKKEKYKITEKMWTSLQGINQKKDLFILLFCVPSK